MAWEREGHNLVQIVSMVSPLSNGVLVTPGRSQVSRQAGAGQGQAQGSCLPSLESGSPGPGSLQRMKILSH